MKKVYAMICISIMLLAGCSQGTTTQKPEGDASTQTQAEQDPKQEPEQQQPEQAADKPADPPKSETQTPANTNDSQKDGSKDAVVKKDRIEVASYAGGNDFELLLEEDQSKEVVKGVPIYYLSAIYTNGDKKLLAQSVDRGEDWTNSIAKIVYPVISNDGTKVYYSTDNTFNRSSGYGAQNYQTRVVDLKTLEDSYFEQGNLVDILNSSHGSYANHVVLELNSLDAAGNPTMVYQVVTPSGEQLVVLEESGNWQAQIDAKLKGQAPSTDIDLQITDIPSNGVDKSSLVESIHGYNVEYSRYYSVVVVDYPPEGGYPFKYGIEFDNPAYSTPDSEYQFVVMGTIHDVRIQSQADMNSEPKLYKVADTIEDAIVIVQSSFPTDFSVDKIHYRDFNGNNYAVTLTDMGDEKKVHAIKLPF